MIDTYLPYISCVFLIQYVDKCISFLYQRDNRQMYYVENL